MAARRIARLGLLGGTSWESTLEYYRRLNEETNRHLGGLSTVEMVIWSLDFGAVWEAKERRVGDAIRTLFDRAARHLAAAGAELIVICSNAGHQRADLVEAAAGRPVVHIVDAVGEALRRMGVRRAGLLGTLETMAGDHYRDRLKTRFGIATLVPTRVEQERVHGIAIDEVSRGIRSDLARADLGRIVADLAGQGAEAVILGCTELPLVAPANPAVPLVDTIAVHVDAIVERALAHSAAASPPRIVALAGA